MRTMNDIEIIIDNRKYTLSGYESEEYLRSVADYINSKHQEFRSKEGFYRLEAEVKNILLELNIADDYFKAKQQIEALVKENKQKCDELLDVENDWIAAQYRLEAAQKELQDLKQEQAENQKKIAQLEAELKECNRKSFKK